MASLGSELAQCDFCHILLVKAHRKSSPASRVGKHIPSPNGKSGEELVANLGPPMSETVVARVVSQCLWALSLGVSRGLEDRSGKRVPSIRTDRGKGWGAQAEVPVLVPNLGAGAPSRRNGVGSRDVRSASCGISVHCWIVLLSGK